MKQNRYITSRIELAARLRYARQIHGLSQQNIADCLNVDRSTYSYYELARINPDIYTLIKICHIYSISIDYFLLEKNKELRQDLKRRL